MTLYQFECKIKALNRPDSPVHLKIKTNKGIIEYYPAFLPSIDIYSKKSDLYYYDLVPKEFTFACIHVCHINQYHFTKDTALRTIKNCKKYFQRYCKDFDNLPIYLHIIDYIETDLHEMVYDIEYNNDTIEYAFEQHCRNRNKKHHNKK